MQHEATFFIMGTAHHMIYYMAPFIRATPNKELCVIDTNESYHEKVRRDFPDLNLVTFDNNDRRMIDYFNSFKIIFLSNAYVIFEDYIRPHISQDTLMVNIQHFSPIKFVDDVSFILGNYLWDVTVGSGQKDIDLLVHHGLSKLDQKNYTNPQWLYIYNKLLQVILGGNLRVKNYLTNRAQKEMVFAGLPKLDPTKKTILYMPTFSYNITRAKNDYCSIPLFTEMLDKLKGSRDYNVICKLHPGLVHEKEMVKSLLLAVQKNTPYYHVDFFGADYLHLMEIADMLFTDRTSAGVDFFYFDKPAFFLDHNDACAKVPTFDDIANSYWHYQFGPIISRENITDIDALIAASLDHDPFQELRKIGLKYLFADTLTVEDIFQELRKHPKYLGTL